MHVAVRRQRNDCSMSVRRFQECESKMSEDDQTKEIKKERNQGNNIS